MKNQKKDTRFVFITGGVISGIGKGITSASLGRLLISQGYSVFPIKMDPYLNEDAGTMNPIQHGEVFVTDDGAETDLDLGHYERFLSLSLDKRSNFTSGAVFRAVLDKERRGDFLGKTIQFVPHITDEIIDRLMAAAEKEKPDFMLVEIGGTIGADMEIQPFVEAVRQLGLKVGLDRVCHLHVVKMDYVFPSDEPKTKPIQNSVRMLTSLGIIPDILVVRAKAPIGKSNMEKISLFCSVPQERIIEARDARNLYDIPLSLEKNGLLDAFLGVFHISKNKDGLGTWKARVRNLISAKETVNIGMVGKYHDHGDAYISVNEALIHAGSKLGVNVNIIPIESDNRDMMEKMEMADAILVPGGYGNRGVEGMLAAVKYARENKKPYLGLCFGLQMVVIEWARNVLNWKNASSTELDQKTKYPVVDILESQKGIDNKGGSQRLGSYVAHLKKGSLVREIYGKEAGTNGTIEERHRHRYEVNPKYHKEFEDSGLAISGKSSDGTLAEFVEIPKERHPFFVATQAHPEFKSRFMEPHPLFVAFIKAAVKNKKK
jgi:CTP synthase